MVDLFFIDFTGLSNSNFQFRTTGTFSSFSPKFCFSKQLFLPDIHATFVLVILAPGAGGTWQLRPNLINFTFKIKK